MLTLRSAFSRYELCYSRLFTATNKRSCRSKQQTRLMVRYTNLKLPDDYPEPWPYREENYFFWSHGYLWWEKTKERFHQNTKLLTIEGNVGSGKEEVAKKIADVFDLYYMRGFKMEDILIDRYGNDLRNFYHMFPKRMRIPDMNMFFQNPYDDLSAVMQDRIYECRWEQYLNSLAHIFNTGQGVILKRPPHTDFVFANAMRDKNFIGKEYFKYYYYLRKLTLPHLQLWPHIVIYLDCPISKCLENIKKRGNPAEIAIVDERYLKMIQESYKDALNEMRRFSHILAYDWTDPGPYIVDRIVEDIERIDLDFQDWHKGEVLDNWFSIGDELYHKMLRSKVTDKHDLRVDAWRGNELAKHEIGELVVYPYDDVHFEYVMAHEVLKSRYSYGHLPQDPVQGIFPHRSWNNLPEKWQEYFWKEQYYDKSHNFRTYFDPLNTEYDPDYLHGHKVY